jgi:hypothetical protein
MKLTHIQTVAITAFVLVLVGVVGYLVFSNTNPQPKTYLNSRYGLWFQYPDNYALEETAATGTQTGMIVTLTKRGIISPSKEHILIGMYDGTSTKTSAVSWIKSSPYSYFANAYQEEPGETVIAGSQSAYLYTWHDGHYGTTLAAPYRGNMITFTVTYADQTDLENRQVFTDLIASVKFLNPQTNASTTSVQRNNALVKPYAILIRNDTK